jgi:hypothetical protein
MAIIANQRRALRHVLPVLMLGLGHAANAGAQPVDADRLDRLRDIVETEVRHVEAESLDANRPVLERLSELRDEVGYLRGRLRRGLPVEERECRRVEQMLLAVRGQALQDKARIARAPRALAREIPVGIELRARVHAIHAGGIDGRQRFDAVTVVDVSGGRTLIPAGAILSGSVTPVDGRTGVLVLLNELTVDGRTYIVELRILEWAQPGVEAADVEFEGDGVVLTHSAVAPGAMLRVRLESALELTEHDG